MTTRPLRDLCKGKFGLQVLDSKPIQITNKRDTSIIELLNEVLNLINGINEKCLAKDVNQMTVKDYIKILCLGRKVGNVLIYKIANILTRIGKQLSERKIVDYKKTLFLFLSLPIKDKIERDRCLNELILFLKMLRTELDVQDELTSIYSGTLTYDTCTERMLKNRHDFVIYTLLGIFTMNNTDILSNDIIKNENDRKALKELSFSIFNINNNNNNGNNSKNTSFKKQQQQLKKQQQQHTTLIDEQLMDMVESDDDEQSEDNMLSINNSTTINGINNTIGGNSLTSSNNNNLTLDKKTNINLHHFPEGLNYFEEIALQLKRCIYGSNKQ
ncbi:hypothetical protein NAEGRDRAFT_82043 [Naegleria gruberi]|uniref:Uncharacterized protein n=1 Tax=Naegleria gruberi TaxID=5762 RepID=D2W1U7_NAEGR|nr:uncharacterized protein NAEGRDRAFT_82043 [Naegleria gruberi]EFC36927.1 hypothetical protein NAEGRDRAFT_82043 [Naegleria gruberi]|eukprot:XP_002669671.1 hypothetical protein NAEGRDRAFT_82043 [Naegleria gruberi strain NEG-M]